MAFVLLVGSGDPDQPMWRSALEGRGHAVVEAETGTFLGIAETEPVEVVVIDISPLRHGVHLIGIMELRHRRPSIKIIAVCGGRDADTLLGMAVQAGADATLRKPFSGERLVRTVARCLGQPLVT